VPAQQRHRDVPAHRQPAQHHSVEVEAVQHRHDVFGHRVERRFVVAERRGAEAAEVGRDDTAHRPQHLPLRGPHPRVQGEGVQQHQGCPGAGLLDVQLDAHRG
jgi:hypothetical protein